MADATQPPAPQMTISKIIKIMLIRIGDERREQIEQHIVNLTGRCSDVSKHEADTKQLIIDTLITVIENLPHKVMLYADLVAMIAQQNASLAQDIIDEVMKHLINSFINLQDSFKSLNVFRWFSALVDRRVICSSAACTLIIGLLDEANKAQKFQADLTLHCVLTFLSFESTSVRLQKEQSIDFGTIIESLKTMMKKSGERALTRQSMSHLNKENSLLELWQIYQNSSTKKFALENVYLSMKAEKIDEIRSSFESSPIRSLPQISILQDLKLQKYSFDDQILGETQPGLYFPLIFVKPNSPNSDSLSNEEQFQKHMLNQVCCDVIQAFKQSHKLTASTIPTIFVGEPLKEQQMDSILSAIFTFILNSDLSESTQPIIHYAQICNLLIKESPKLHQQINDFIIQLIQQVEFDQCRVVPNLIEFHVFLNCQQDLSMASNEFLNDLKTAIGGKESQFKKVTHYYLSFCCLLGYHKTISEKLSEEFNDLMPNQDVLKPTYTMVRSKNTREGPSDRDEDHEVQNDEEQRIDKEVSQIMEVLSQKGDFIENLTQLLSDTSLIKTEGLKLKQLFLEIILTKYGGRSLEHITEGIRRVKPVLESQYKDQEEAQKMALDTIFKAYNMDQLSAQDFEKENLFQLRSKVVNLVERFNQMEVLDTTIIINWCADILSKHNKKSLDFTHSQVVLTLIQKMKLQKKNIIRVFVQERDKIGEEKVETPYEKRQREQAEERGQSYGNNEEQKTKSPEEIDLLKTDLEKQYRLNYENCQSGEVNTISICLDKLYSQGLDQLADRVLILSSHISQVQKSVKTQNSQIVAIYNN